MTGMGILSEILIILGCLTILAAIYCRNYRSNKEHFKGRAEATVIDIEIDEPDERGKARGIHDYFYPVFAYYANGRLIKARYRYGSNPCKFRRNEKVNIQYKLTEPSRFVIQRKNPLEQLSKTLYYLGLFLIVAGGILYMLFATRYA